MKLMTSADRDVIKADGKDLAFITVKITDKDGLIVPRSNNQIELSIKGPGEIVATDNGDPTNMVSFSSKEREAFNGLCLVIVRSSAGNPGTITVTANSPGMKITWVNLTSK
jgi:beta-galactosidase